MSDRVRRLELQTSDPTRQRLHQIGQVMAGCIIDKPSIGVERVLCARDEDFRPVDRMHIEGRTDGTQMQLSF